jgi:hypothetical protein
VKKLLEQSVDVPTSSVVAPVEVKKSVDVPTSSVVAPVADVVPL